MKMKEKTVEVIVITYPDEARGESVLDKLQKFITDNNGMVNNVDKWGIKYLPYQIQDLVKGFYFLLEVKADKELYKRIDISLCLDTEVLRHLLVTKS